MTTALAMRGTEILRGHSRRMGLTVCVVNTPERNILSKRRATSR